MRKFATAFLLVVLPVFLGCSGSATEEDESLVGPYLGQTPPGESAELFAPGIVNKGLGVRDVAMTPEGDALYFGITTGPFVTIAESRLVDGRWTTPEIASFASDSRFFNLEPHISPDGSRFFFLSTRPADGREPLPEEIGSWRNQDIWAMNRTDTGWGEPYNLSAPINSDAPEFFPSTTTDGTMYFTREDAETRASYIYRSRFVDGTYQQAERLPDQVNSTPAQYNAFVAPDESYLIVCTASRPDTRGSADYYIVFRNDDDTWTEPVNMGDKVNSPSAGYSPYVTPDGKYFFFMSTRSVTATDRPRQLTIAYLDSLHVEPGNGASDIYWISASFIDSLRVSID